MPIKTSVRACVLALLAYGAAAAAQDRGGFKNAVAAAMTRMHAAMTVSDTGEPDRDFAAMMIPHHQGAIDMAAAELRFGKDERLRRLAQGIIVEQRQEIAVMQAIIAEKSVTAKTPRHDEGEHQ